MQTPKFTQPKRNKARILPRQAALLSLWVLSPQKSVGMAVAGMGFKTRAHVLWLPARESGLAEGSPLHGGEQKSTMDKSPLGALTIRDHSWISLLCLSVLISKMGTSGAYDWWE